VYSGTATARPESGPTPLFVSWQVPLPYRNPARGWAPFFNASFAAASPPLLPREFAPNAAWIFFYERVIPLPAPASALALPTPRPDHAYPAHAREASAALAGAGAEAAGVRAEAAAASEEWFEVCRTAVRPPPACAR
jgi:hypothetical protein